MVNDKQVALYRKHRAKGKSQEAAATRAGMTAKTARKWEVGPLPSEIMKGPRPWRTRNDPLEEVWENRVVPFLQRGPDLCACLVTVRRLQSEASYS